MSRRVERRQWRQMGEPAWRRCYAQRMRDGLEYCRGCGVEMRHVNLQARGLRFGHIRAACLGGGDGPGNITIVCGDCDEHMGPHDWTGVLDGLRAEAQWRHHQQAILRDLIGNTEPRDVLNLLRQRDADLDDGRHHDRTDDTTASSAVESTTGDDIGTVARVELDSAA